MLWPMIMKIYYSCFRWWMLEGHDRRQDKDKDEGYDKNKYD
jgi:hypothetical protein